MVTVVVLLGAPGSGKSAVGQALGARGLRWREWEPMIVERWGSREAFVANKADALPALHREILEWIAEESSPAAIESTGLSDAPLIELLDDAGQSFVVRLDVTEDEALRRVDDREVGRHLTDDLDANRRVYRAFRDRVVPHTRVDLVIDTEAQSVEAIAASIFENLRLT